MMKNTDKFDCLAVKECIIQGIIKINELSEDELEALIDFETENIIECQTEPDMSFLNMCNDAMHRFEDYRKDISDEKLQELGDKAYIEFTQKQITASRAKKPHRFLKRLATTCAAMLVFCFLSLSVAAVALGSYSAAWEYISSNVSEILNLNGSKKVDGITIIKSDYTKKYDTIEELLIAENLDILYPAALPEGVEVERVKVFAFNNDKEKIMLIFNDTKYSIQIKNYFSGDLSSIKNHLTYTANGVTFYITQKNDGSYNAISQKNGFEYTITCSTYENLLFILSNMKGLSK